MRGNLWVIGCWLFMIPETTTTTCIHSCEMEGTATSIALTHTHITIHHGIKHLTIKATLTIHNSQQQTKPLSKCGKTYIFPASPTGPPHPMPSHGNKFPRHPLAMQTKPPHPACNAPIHGLLVPSIHSWLLMRKEIIAKCSKKKKSVLWLRRRLMESSYKPALHPRKYWWCALC